MAKITRTNCFGSLAKSKKTENEKAAAKLEAREQKLLADAARRAAAYPDTFTPAADRGPGLGNPRLELLNCWRRDDAPGAGAA